MKIILGNIDGKSLGLNASEACVYAAIEKCSRGDNAKGWYGTMDALAAAIPCKIGRMSVTRAIAKLLNMGLVQEYKQSLYANAQDEQSNAQNEQNNAQNEQNNAQNEQNNAQNEQNNAQNDLPPAPSYIKENKKKNEKINERNNAHAITRDAWGALKAEFYSFWAQAAPAEEFKDRYKACCLKWAERSPAARTKMLEAVQDEPLPPNQNPWMYIADFPEPTPTDYNGSQSLPDEPLVFAKLGDAPAGIYKRKEAELFNLTIIKPFEQ